MSQERTCTTCGKPFVGHTNQRYCQDPCISPTAQLLGRKPLRDLECARCGAAFQGRANQHYCSDECRAAPANTKRFKLNPNYEYGYNAWRKHVLAIHGHKCVDCGATEGLHAHHIVPQARGGKNVITNGMVVCESCHRIRHDPLQAGDDLVERIARRVVELLAA